MCSLQTSLNTGTVAATRFELGRKDQDASFLLRLKLITTASLYYSDVQHRRWILFVKYSQS